MIERASIPYDWVMWAEGRMCVSYWLRLHPVIKRLVAQGMDEEDAVRQAVRDDRGIEAA